MSNKRGRPSRRDNEYISLDLAQERESLFVQKVMQPFYELMNCRVKAILEVLIEMVPKKCSHCGAEIELLPLPEVTESK